MARGIKIFKIPSDYSDFGDIYNNGGLQIYDIALVFPSDYNAQMEMYQYRPDIGNDYNNPKWIYIKDIDLNSTVNDISTIIYTDENIITNVTPIRKAHQEDYRNLLRMLKNISLNKFGDYLFGTFNFSDAKMQWQNKNLYTSQMYLDSSSESFILSIGDSTVFRIKNNDDSFSAYSASLLELSNNNFNLYVDAYLKEGLYVDGGTELRGKVELNDSDGDTLIHGATEIQNTLTVQDETVLNSDVYIHAKLTVDEDINANKDINVAANIIAQGLDVDHSLSTDVVTDLNADMLDGKHLSEIEIQIPEFGYAGDEDFLIKQYETAQPNAGKVYKNAIALGKRVYMSLYNPDLNDRSVYILPGATDNQIQNLEYCSCTCTCECTCTCTCPCTGPCCGEAGW